jgi:hypothetical protein
MRRKAIDESRGGATADYVRLLSEREWGRYQVGPHTRPLCTLAILPLCSNDTEIAGIWSHT